MLCILFKFVQLTLNNYLGKMIRGCVESCSIYIDFKFGVTSIWTQCSSITVLVFVSVDM